MNPNKPLLFRFEWDCGREGEIKGMFVAAQAEVDDLIGKRLVFCEPFGKHSEISGNVEEGEITLVTNDQKFIKMSLDIGTIPSGFDPTQYIHCEECCCCIEDCECDKKDTNAQ